MFAQDSAEDLFAHLVAFKETLDDGVRINEDLIGRSDGPDHAVMQKSDSISYTDGAFEIMGDHDRRDSEITLETSDRSDQSRWC